MSVYSIQKRLWKFPEMYEETGVYLLAGLITDRERLAMEIDRETSSDKLRSIKDQLDGKICLQHFFCISKCGPVNLPVVLSTPSYHVMSWYMNYVVAVIKIEYFF